MPRAGHAMVLGLIATAGTGMSGAAGMSASGWQWSFVAGAMISTAVLTVWPAVSKYIQKRPCDDARVHHLRPRSVHACINETRLDDQDRGQRPGRAVHCAALPRRIYRQPVRARPGRGTAPRSRRHRAALAELIDGPLAHLPSGQFDADNAWLTCIAIAHNLTRQPRRWPDSPPPDPPPSAHA